MAKCYRHVRLMTASTRIAKAVMGSLETRAEACPRAQPLQKGLTGTVFSRAKSGRPQGSLACSVSLGELQTQNFHPSDTTRAESSKPMGRELLGLWGP